MTDTNLTASEAAYRVYLAASDAARELTAARDAAYRVYRATNDASNFRDADFLDANAAYQVTRLAHDEANG